MPPTRRTAKRKRSRATNEPPPLPVSIMRKTFQLLHAALARHEPRVIQMLEKAEASFRLYDEAYSDLQNLALLLDAAEGRKPDDPASCAAQLEARQISR